MRLLCNSNQFGGLSIVRILIVDDEPRHLRGMVNLIGRLRPEDQVVAAKDGLSAMELVKAHSPEAILTDIRMPGMDGLEFLERLKVEGIKTRVVMVSAYNLFEYAQKAVRHGAFDYLLKPVEIEKITEVLSRIDLQLTAEQQQYREEEELQHRLKLASSAYLSRLILSWLNGSAAPEELEELNRYEWLRESGVAVYSELKHRRDSGEQQDSGSFVRSLEQAWSRWGEAITVPLSGMMEDGVQAAVTLITLEALTQGKREEARFIAQSLAAEWVHAGQLVHGIGPQCHSLLAEAPRSYLAARTANSYNFYDFRQGLLFADELISTPGAGAPDWGRLYDALKMDDAALVQEVCAETVYQLADAGQASPMLLKEQASLMLLQIRSDHQDILDKKTGQMLTDTATMLIRSCRSYQELMTKLNHALREAHLALALSRQDKSEVVIAECLGWIQGHTKENLTLERAAEHFHFNPSYFSTLIKNRTGKTFSEHVTAVRMKRAKELLAAEQFRVYEISLECGFQDTKYFCRVFKKYHGMSPKAYKHALSQRKREA
ncbi:response regulator [Paenibacillus sp. LMG 31459]|uniref:Response regulator n=1 Tax=Paenibacillus phytohabitans TaxID=2654978 RepID=A0ABX1YPQ8_9BACL|nr:response regulator [Paenibacillus phytohabitans]